MKFINNFDSNNWNCIALEDSLASFNRPRDGKSTIGSQNPNFTEGKYYLFPAYLTF